MRLGSTAPVAPEGRTDAANNETVCREYPGPASLYQHKAAGALILDGKDPQPWDWIVPTCGNLRCINAAHLVTRSHVRIQYPHDICIYCGERGFTKDHLLPRGWSGESKRKFVATVPACGECNSLLGPTLTWSITERRAIAHAKLRWKRRRLLMTQEFSESELDEFEGRMRDFIEASMKEKARLIERLEFPKDAAYDARALQKTGLEDPWAMGLLLSDDQELKGAVRAAMRPKREKTWSYDQAVPADRHTAKCPIPEVSDTHDTGNTGRTTP